jgi:RNA recognition motif-containing protein
MKQSISYNLFSKDQKENCFKNLIEFKAIYENIQQQQREQEIKKLARQKQQQQQHQSRTFLIESSFDTNSSFSSTFNQLTIETKQIDYKKLFVGNLPSSTKLEEIIEFFKKYGPINEKLSVVKDQNYAFVHFYNEEDAKIALKEANDSLFKNRYIRVQFSTSQAHIKKSKTFDASNGLFKETAISPPSSSSSSSIIMTEAQKIIQPNMRPITKSSNKSALKRSSTDFNIIQQQQQQQSYYSPFQYSQLFEMDLILAPSSSTATTNQMTKSATFQY